MMISLILSHEVSAINRLKVLKEESKVNRVIDDVKSKWGARGFIFFNDVSGSKLKVSSERKKLYRIIVKRMFRNCSMVLIDPCKVNPLKYKRNCYKKFCGCSCNRFIPKFFLVDPKFAASDTHPMVYFTSMNATLGKSKVQALSKNIMFSYSNFAHTSSSVKLLIIDVVNKKSNQYLNIIRSLLVDDLNMEILQIVVTRKKGVSRFNYRVSSWNPYTKTLRGRPFKQKYPWFCDNTRNLQRPGVKVFSRFLDKKTIKLYNSFVKSNSENWKPSHYSVMQPITTCARVMNFSIHINNKPTSKCWEMDFIPVSLRTCNMIKLLLRHTNVIGNIC